MSKTAMCNIPDEILEKLQKDISEIKVALLGNEYNPEGGLLYRMREAETCQGTINDRITKLEEKYRQIKLTASVAATIVSALFALLFKLKDIINLFSNM